MRRLAPLAGLLILVACGGGGSATVPAPGGIGPATAIPFGVTVGASSSVTRVGITSSAASGTAEQSIAVAPSSPGCTAAAAGTRTCTASLSFPTGSQTLTVATYGATTVRSAVRTTLTGARVALAVATPIAQISLDLAATTLAGGAAGTTTLYVTARDANGNTIVGSFGGATIAIASSDTTGSVTLSPTTITAGGTDVAVTYNGSGSLGAVVFTATSTGVASTAIVPATLSFTSSQAMYIGAGGSIMVFPMNASGNVSPSERISIVGSSINSGAQPDGHGQIWTAVFDQRIAAPSGTPTFYGSRMATVPVGSAGPVVPTYLPLPANTVVVDFGIDGAGNLYTLQLSIAPATNAVTFSIAEYAPGAQAPTTVSTPPAIQSQANCNAIAVAVDGTTAVNCADPTLSYGQIFVFAPGATGSPAPVRTIAGAATTLSYGGILLGYSYLAFAADGSIVTNDVNATINTTATGFTNGDAAIDVFAPGANGNVAPVRRIAGPGTGLDAVSFSKRQGGVASVGIDPTGATYAVMVGSQSGLTGEQLLRYAPGANGAALPESVLAGPLTDLTGDVGGAVHFASAVIAPVSPTASTPSVTGDFLALTPGRGWNYTFTPAGGGNSPASTPSTLSLYAQAPSGGSTPVDAFQLPGTNATAIGNAGSVLAAEALFYQATGGGYFASGYVPVSSGASLGGFVPIPGDGIKLTGGTLTQGQTFESYVGLTATVISVGAVPGSGACPGGAATGAIVQYVFSQSTETVGYVPGCGITYLVTDNGSTAILTSVGSYTSPAALGRAPLAHDAITSLRRLWRSAFTPWSAR